MTRPRIAALLLTGLLILTASTGCADPTAQDKENAQQAEASNSLVDAQPVPHFPYSLRRQNLTEIEAAEATGSAATTTFFLVPIGAGQVRPIRICSSIGLPIPANASLSNPHQVVSVYQNGHWVDGVVDQLEPNGTYPSPSTAGTYAMCVGADGPRPAYFEGIVEAEFGTAIWNPVTQMVEPTGISATHFSRGCAKLNGRVVCH